jgi:membrane-bound ClpP family serine protease
MSGRLIINIISTIAEEAAALYVGLWLLPHIGVTIPVPVVLVAMFAWLAWTVFTYVKGTHALVRKPVDGLADMTGLKGIVVRPLQPDGMVKIRGELWAGRAVSGRIDSGAGVVVVARDGLKLVVRPQDSGGGTPPVHQ